MVAREERSVAFRNKVMDTRLPRPAGCGDKYDVSGWCCGRMFSAFYMFFKYPSPAGKPAPSPSRGEGWHRPWCQKILGTRPRMTGGRGANSFGRSMIEMLGVLAIVGILSVGGIAGYSQAMEKWRINKMAEEYSYLIHGLLEHLNEFQNLPDYTGLIDTGLAMGIIPDNWKRVDNLHVNDAFGNKIKPYVRDNKLVIDFYFGGHNSEANTQGFYKKACKVLMRDMAAPLHYSVNMVWIFFGSSSQSKIFFGDSVCKENCLRDITLKDINDACNLCDSRMCGLIMEF